MVKIFNTLRGPDPLGAAFANLGKSLFGDTTANAINSEKLYAAQRENAEMDNLMARAAKSGVQNLGADPIAQAILLGSGYDSSKFGQVGLMGAATGFGAADPRTQAWQVGTGQAYDNTAGAFGQKLAETARSNNMESADRRYGVDQTQKTERDKFFYTPKEVINPDGTPGFARQGELAGSTFSPILSEADQKGTLLGQNFDNLPALDPMQRQVLGANPSDTSRTPRNYVTPQGSFITYDGVTNAQTGAPLPAGGYIGNVEGGAGDVGLTNSVTTDLQSGIMAGDKFVLMADRMLGLAKDNPSSFGLVGNLRSKGQELGQALDAVGGLFGGQNGIATAAQEARRTLNAEGLAGLMPELYDPSLPAVQMLGGLILYSGASALAGQENRSVSDGDIRLMKNILGDPMGIFESAQSVSVKISLARDIVMEHKRLAQAYLDKGMAVPSDGALAQQAAANVLGRQGQAAGAPQPVAPAAPNAAPQVEQWERGPDGQLRRVQ